MCWEGDHDFYAKIIASIVLGIWIVLLPFLCLYFLLKNRQDLETKENLETMGFIYIGLQKKCFYWEIILHLIKMGLIFVETFMEW